MVKSKIIKINSVDLDYNQKYKIYPWAHTDINDWIRKQGEETNLSYREFLIVYVATPFSRR